ncbi:MAG: hypothetical protein Faunusvirus9_10 [Faunusvirus sp.]|uniref:Uncharacterized protein n=1 Tax=Faunusvirus sp. TaxID=2487766 RepID=A0A3G4ZWN9_9VIRU|nr:MAG: hypothetical protein Faunusvirus9_10 [Faunusvirus sp.]
MQSVITNRPYRILERSVYGADEVSVLTASLNTVTRQQILKTAALKQVSKYKPVFNDENLRRTLIKYHIAQNDCIVLDENYYLNFNDVNLVVDGFTNTGRLLCVRYTLDGMDNEDDKQLYDFVQVALKQCNISTVELVRYHISSNDTNVFLTVKTDNTTRKYSYIMHGSTIHKSKLTFDNLESATDKLFQTHLSDPLIGDDDVETSVVENVDSDDEFKLDDTETKKTNKRKLAHIEETSSAKRLKLEPNNIDKSWVPASKTRNYALGDPLLDYCEIYNVRNITDKPNRAASGSIKSYKKFSDEKREINSFTDFLMNNGIMFERSIMDELNKNFQDKIVKIGESYEAKNFDKWRATYDAMCQGVPLIVQGVLQNADNKTYGCPDLLVRSDYLNKIVKNSAIDEDEMRQPAKYLGGKKYHYRVVDIKSSKMVLNTDGATMRNEGHIKPYKCQILIYTLALAKLQGFNPNVGYILGRGWTMTQTIDGEKCKSGSVNPFNKLAQVDFNKRDKQYNAITDECIEWYRKVNTADNNAKNKVNMHHDPPSIPELNPNMCNTYDGKYHKVKRQIADKHDEITSIWMCGPENRRKAFGKDVYKWSDKKCTAELMGICGKDRKMKVDKIMKFNRDHTNRLISIDKIADEHNIKNRQRLYVDFETIGEPLMMSVDSPYKNIKEIIFWIGVTVVENGKNQYTSFAIGEISLAEERKMIDKFIAYVDMFADPCLIHWSHAEPSMFKRAEKRHKTNWNIDTWFDACRLFNNTPILIKGALNFSEKTVGRQMQKHGMIKSTWNDDYMNGLDAMFNAWRIYLTNQDGSHKTTLQKLSKIGEYNRTDCNVLCEIMEYIIAHHMD